MGIHFKTLPQQGCLTAAKSNISLLVELNQFKNSYLVKTKK